MLSKITFSRYCMQKRLYNCAIGWILNAGLRNYTNRKQNRSCCKTLSLKYIGTLWYYRELSAVSRISVYNNWDPLVLLMKCDETLVFVLDIGLTSISYAQWLQPKYFLQAKHINNDSPFHRRYIEICNKYVSNYYSTNYSHMWFNLLHANQNTQIQFNSYSAMYML